MTTVFRSAVLMPQLSAAVAALLVFGVAGCGVMARKQVNNSSLLEQEVLEANRKIDEIYHRVSVIQFMVDNHERALREMGKGGAMPAAPMSPPAGADTEPPAGLTETTLPPVTAARADTEAPPGIRVQESAEALYSRALAAYQDHDYDRAAALFATVAESYPAHELADNALYWMGECHYSQKAYPAAMVEFQKVLSRYPEGSKVSDAMLKIAYSYEALGDKDAARTYLRRVIKEYPFSPAAQKAEERIKGLR